MEELADRFFDKEVPDKVVNLAIYDIITDELIMRAVELNRGWGGKGLLGSEFMQGMLNRFPIRFEETRKMMLERLRQKKLNKKALLELSECDGVSKGLV